MLALSSFFLFPFIFISIFCFIEQENLHARKTNLKEKSVIRHCISGQIQQASSERQGSIRQMAQKCAAAEPQEMTLCIQRYGAVRIACELRRSLDVIMRSSSASAKASCLSHISHLSHTSRLSHTLLCFPMHNFQLSNVKN